MKTSCCDIWTECQSCSELEEEEDDDEGETVAFSEAGGKGRPVGASPPAAAPFSPEQDQLPAR